MFFVTMAMISFGVSVAGHLGVARLLRPSRAQNFILIPIILLGLILYRFSWPLNEPGRTGIAEGTLWDLSLEYSAALLYVLLMMKKILLH